jgi:plasmid stabilization system protein ParE
VKLPFTARAYRHLQSIDEFLFDRNPIAARSVAARILALDMLASFPDAGRPGRSSGTREWVVRGLPYIIVYEVLPEALDGLVVLGIFHAAQDRESIP